MSRKTDPVAGRVSRGAKTGDEFITGFWDVSKSDSWEIADFVLFGSDSVLHNSCTNVDIVPGR